MNSYELQNPKFNYVAPLIPVILSEGERPSRRTPTRSTPVRSANRHSHRALYFFSVTISEKSAIVENSFSKPCRSASRFARTVAARSVTLRFKATAIAPACTSAATAVRNLR